MSALPFFARLLCGVLLLGGAACRKKTEPAPGPLVNAETQTAGAPGVAPAASKAPPPREIWKEFSGERAMAEVKQQVELGPRPAGTPELARTRELLKASLQKSGWTVTEQSFTDETPRGPIEFVNVLARFGQGPSEPGSRALVCSHYDTKRFSTIRFVGASDGASSSGALLELARVLALDPALAARVDLVFFDGEEALQQFTETDGLYGSRFYAKALAESGRAGQYQFGVLWDMIGDRELSITLPPDSPKELAQGIFRAAEVLGSRQSFSYFNRDLLDDHVPLNHLARVPTIDLIDFDYLPWHTADDTLDKLSPESLRTVGAVTLYYLKKTFPR